MQVRVPRELDAEGREALAKLVRFEPENPRKGLFS